MAGWPSETKIPGRPYSSHCSLYSCIALSPRKYQYPGDILWGKVGLLYTLLYTSFLVLKTSKPYHIFEVRKKCLQASRSISPSILLIFLKILKSYTLFSSSPPSSTITTSFPATRRASQRLKELQIGPRSNKSFSLQGGVTLLLF